jgi:hypothetical protein
MAAAVKLTITGTGTGTCSLSGKESCDGLTVTFEDGTTNNQFLGWKAFQQILRLKAGVTPKTAAPTPPQPTPNGPVATK